MNKSLESVQATSALPEEVRRQVAAVGHVWGVGIQKHRDIVLAAYAPLLAQPPTAGLTVERERARADPPRQRVARSRTHAPTTPTRPACGPISETTRRGTTSPRPSLGPAAARCRS